MDCCINSILDLKCYCSSGLNIISPITYQYFDYKVPFLVIPHSFDCFHCFCNCSLDINWHGLPF